MSAPVVSQHLINGTLTTTVGVASITQAITVAAGERLVVYCTYDFGTGSTGTIADTKGNTWALRQTATETANQQMYCWECLSPATGATTITVTFSAAVFGPALYTLAVTGGDTNAAASASNWQVTPGLTTDAVTSTSLTPNTASSLLIAISQCTHLSSGGLPSAGTGFTSLDTMWDYGSGVFTRAETKTLTSAASTAATFTATGNRDHLTIALAISEPGAAPATPGPVLRTQQRAKGFPPRSPLPGVARLGIGLLVAQLTTGQLSATISGAGDLSGSLTASPVAGMAQPQPMAYATALGTRFPGPPRPLLGSGLLISSPPAMQVGAITASCAGAGALNATASAAGALSATAAGTGALTATASAAGALAGTAAGVGALNGATSSPGSLTSACAGAGALTGSATALAGITGTCAGVGALVGTASAAGTLAGSCAGVGALAGTVQASGALAGTAAGVGALTGTTTATGAATASCAGAGALSGSLLQPGNNAACAGVGGLTGTLSALSGATAACAGTGGLVCTASGKAAATGTATGAGGIGAAITATATLTAAPAGVGGFVGIASAPGALSSTTAGLGSLIGTISQISGNSVTMPGVGGFSGTLTAKGALSSGTAGIGGFVGVLVGSSSLSATAGGAGSFAGNLTPAWLLRGVMPGSGALLGAITYSVGNLTAIVPPEHRMWTGAGRIRIVVGM
jgi:hypothetical protein